MSKDTNSVQISKSGPASGSLVTQYRGIKGKNTKTVSRFCGGPLLTLCDQLEGKRSAPLKSGIDPTKNFLLKNAEQLAQLTDETNTISLYRRANGRLLILTKSTNPLVHDKLNVVDPLTAKIKFNIEV